MKKRILNERLAAIVVKQWYKRAITAFMRKPS